MSVKNTNPVNRNNPKRIAIVLANPAILPSTGTEVGFWWAELTHPWHAFAEKGYHVELFSPDGGAVVGDAMSDPRDPSGYSADDLISMGFIATPTLLALTENTRAVSDIDVARFDAILIAGGQSPMASFEAATELHRAFEAFHAAGKIACALCHGTSILAFAKAEDGSPLVAGKTVTGFANVEEDYSDNAVWEYGILPKGKSLMPWRIEDRLKSLGANYVQAGLWRGFALRDGNLITGQQNFSGAETAALVIEALGG